VTYTPKSSVKVAITIDRQTLRRVDGLVYKKVFPNRSRAIQEAVAEKLPRMERSRLASECAKLDPKFEKALAEEGLVGGKHGPSTKGRFAGRTSSPAGRKSTPALRSRNALNCANVFSFASLMSITMSRTIDDPIRQLQAHTSLETRFPIQAHTMFDRGGGSG
jgi:Arc/MetJ-type ribon-helix-helix transcriptional regulator